MSDLPAPTAAFGPARRVRSFDDVSQQIRGAISSGQIALGERLPNERDLCEIFSVSRPTLREALRSLEASGLVEIRAGAKGGAFATRPSEQTLGSALATLVNFRGASNEELAEFRVPFEAENARLAALRAEGPDVALLHELIAEARAAARTAETWEPLALIDVRWHEAVARATKNSIRVGIALGIQEAQMRYVRGLRPTVEQYRRSIPREIARITTAIEQREPDLASELMGTHISGWNRRNERLRVAQQTEATPPQRRSKAASASKRARTTGGSTKGSQPGHTRSA